MKFWLVNNVDVFCEKLDYFIVERIIDELLYLKILNIVNEENIKMVMIKLCKLFIIMVE